MGALQIRPGWAGRIPVRSFLALALLPLLITLTPKLFAQDEAAQPARAVRLSYVDGKVQLSQGEQPIAEQATINTPLLEGMTLSTANDGKAEIQLEDGSVARIAPNSTLTITKLSGTGTSAEADLTLDHGEGYFELQSTGQAGAIRIHFDGSTVTASGYSVLRAQYDTPPGALAVFAGNAHLERGNNIFLDMHEGESLTFNGNSASSYDLTESIPPDSWDAWNTDRDYALNAELASQTPATSDLSQNNPSNPAWSDLDSSGSWYNVPSQGYVWSPYEAANPGFDPYGYGQWVWLPSYGYTWASSYSWGYVPFSCGAWNYYDAFGWGWAPGYGGCTPWWRSGFYVGVSIGFAPGWYRPIHRPGPPRVHPWPGHPIPMIAVRRNEPGMGSPLPPRDRNTPVSIGGATVVGLRPFPGRTSPRPGPIVRGSYGITQGGGLNNRPAFIAPRNSYNQPSNQPSQGVFSPGPGTPRVVDPARPRVFPPNPQPGRIYSMPGNRGNAVTDGPGGTISPPPSPRPSAPMPPPSVGSPSRPGPTPGGGYRPAPAPIPGGFGTMRSSPAPNPGGGGGVIRSGPAPSPGGGAPHGGGAPAPGGGGARGGGGGGGHR